MSAVAEGRSIAYSAETAGRAGRVACQVLRSHGNDGSLIFSIIIRNDSSDDVSVVAFIAAERAHGGTLVQCSVQRTCDFSTTVELKRPAYRQPDLHIEVHGEDIGFVLIVPNESNAGSPAEQPSFALTSVEPARQQLPAIIRPSNARHTFESPRAEPPRSALDGRTLDRRSASRTPAALPMFALFLALMAGIGIAVFRPQIVELQVPQQARPGRAVSIGYRATGLGTIAYTIVGPDAVDLAAGPLTVGSGAFSVVLPTVAGRAYLVRLSIKGVFGSDIAERYVHVPASATEVKATAPPVSIKRPAPAPAPEIRSLALDRATLTGGGNLNVYYDVNAASGDVALVDPAAQITYARAQIDASGHATLPVPAVGTERFLSVVLTARRGSIVSRSRIAVTAEPQASPTPQADAASVAPGQAGSSAAALVPAISAPQTVQSGHTFEVTIEAGVPGLTLVLNDMDGNELGRSLVEPNQRSVTFNAPNLRSPATIRLLAVYPQGSGSETIVKTILVIAR